ncbi:hypothetical protein DSECCO2_209240 [anaerobic digester metagenome]
MEETNKGTKNFQKALFTFIAIVFWVYFIINNLVFNFEEFIIEKFIPQISWINNWPLLKLALIVLLMFIILKFVLHRKAIWILYILFYPVVLIVFKIPYILIKNKRWFAISVFIRLIINFLSSLKTNTIIASLYIILLFSLYIFTSNSMILVLISLMALMIFVICIRTIYFNLRPSAVVRAFKKVNSSFMKAINSSTQQKSEVKSGNQQLSQIDKIQYRVLCNRLLLFASNKMQNYTHVLYDFARLAFSVVSLFILVLISFAICNYRLYQIMPNSFFYNGLHAPDGILFFYYCVQNLFHNSIPYLYPTLNFARFLQILEYVAGFLIITLFIGTFLSVIIKKRQKETNEVIQTLQKSSKELEISVIADLNVENIDAAMQELQNAKASLYSAIKYLSNLT